MNGLKKLLDSYKGTAFLLVIVVVGVLVGMGKVTYEQFVKMVTWLFGMLAGSRAIEEGAKGFSGTNSIHFNAPKTAPTDAKDEEE